MSTFLYFLTIILQILTFAVGIYSLSIGVFGWIKRKEPKGSDYKPEKTFAMVVAAHNEEGVIEDLIDSLLTLNYPRELYDIFVIADNCDDNTAQLAQKKGAIVYERFNKVQKGKGYALEYLFNIIFKKHRHYDGICVFDADNLVSPNFLLEMNKQLCKGYRAVQGYTDTKNPNDSWITMSYALAFWTVNRLYQLPRYYLGLTCGLSGTGFCISTDLIKELGWGATCLTEDLEFTCKLALNGEKVAWAHDAIIYDEKPLKLKQSWRQRKRWMQGHADCAERFYIPLLKKAIKEKNFMAFDQSMYLLQPVRVLLIGLASIFMYLQMFYPKGTFFNIGYIFPTYMWSLIVVAQLMYGPLIVAIERKFSWRMLFMYLFVYPIYCLSWIPITIQGMLQKDNKEWSHTLHTRKITLNELEQQPAKTK